MRGDCGGRGRRGCRTLRVVWVLVGRSCRTAARGSNESVNAALACGGWPPLGGQDDETLAVAEAGAARGGDKHYVTYYRSLQNWPERDAVSKLTCPRLVFAGTNDQFVAEGHSIRIGPSVSEHRNELEGLGWTVRLVDGFGHESRREA